MAQVLVLNSQWNRAYGSVVLLLIQHPPGHEPTVPRQSGNLVQVPGAPRPG